MNFADSGMIKTGVDLLTKLATVIDKITGVIGKLPAGGVLNALLGIGLFKGIGGAIKSGFTPGMTGFQTMSTGTNAFSTSQRINAAMAENAVKHGGNQNT